MHRRIGLGIAHEQIDHERNADHAGEIIIEPILMADRLESQRHRIGSAAEDRNRQRIGQADADGADVGGKQLGFHHRVDRGVARHDHPRRRDQQERRVRAFDGLQRREQRDRKQHARDAEADEQPFAADAVRDRAIDRLQDHAEDECAQRHHRGLIVGEADRELEEFLHIRWCRCRMPRCRPRSARPRAKPRADISSARAATMSASRPVVPPRRRRSPAGCAA
jgi:hypothetical protein